MSSPKILLVILCLLLIGLRIFSKNESLFSIPILLIAKIVYAITIFIVFNNQKQYINNKDNTSKWRFLNKVLSLFKGKITSSPALLSAVFIFIISILMASFTSDISTFIFTLFALFLVWIVTDPDQFKNHVKNEVSRALQYRIMQSYRNRSFLAIVFVILILLTPFFIRLIHHFESSSKPYRITSLLYFPNDEIVKEVSRRARESVAEHIYLLKFSLSNYSLLPDFNKSILGTWKSTFFTDHAVLWDFVLGGYFFFFLYLFLIAFMSYLIISLLMLLNHNIPLTKRKELTFRNDTSFILTLFLSIFLVQYIYTFFANLWALPLVGQSPGILSPSKLELLFHFTLINFLTYQFKTVNVSSNRTNIQGTILNKKRINVYSFIIILTVIMFIFLLIQFVRIIKSSGNSMKIETIQTSTLPVTENPPTLFLENAKEAFANNRPEEFRNYYFVYNNNKSLLNTKSEVSSHSIKDRINLARLDSVSQIKDNNFLIKQKINNGKNAIVLNNPYLSGYPYTFDSLKTSVRTIHLQTALNQSLNNWANNIKAIGRKYEMITGAIFVANIHNGFIEASASYPFLYNGNYCYMRDAESKLNDNINKILSKPMKREPYKIIFNNDEIYKSVNMASKDQRPGSVVKPLLAYGALSLLSDSENLSTDSLGLFLGRSQPEPAVTLFSKILQAHKLDDFEKIYKNDLSPHFIYHDYDGINLPNHAIGGQSNIPLRDIVQAYMRIQTGYKVSLTYTKDDENNKSPGKLSLSKENLSKLRTAMNYSLRSNISKATAQDVGNALRAKNINTTTLLAKTGTAQFPEIQDNLTSTFILVTDEYVIGIQLFGYLPENKSAGLAARNLFIENIPIFIRNDILMPGK